MLESLLAMVTREAEAERQIADGRRSAIATVLGFNGVLIGLSLFGSANVLKAKGVLEASDAKALFAWLVGTGIVALAIGSAALLKVLASERWPTMSDRSLDEIVQATQQIDAGETASATSGLVASIYMLAGRDKAIRSLRAANDEQRKLARAGMIATAVAFMLLTAAGLVVVTEAPL